MSGLSSEQVALLVDIGHKAPLDLNPERRLLVEALLTGGFIKPSTDDDAELAPYALTAKADRLLSERGADTREG